MLAKDEVLRLLISMAKASSVAEVRVTPLRVRLLLLLLKDPAIIRASVRAEAVTPPNAFNSAADCAADAARSLVKVSVLPSRPVISRVCARYPLSTAAMPASDAGAPLRAQDKLFVPVEFPIVLYDPPPVLIAEIFKTPS